MITSYLKINVPLDRKEDAIQTVRTILGWTSAQPGCISMALYQDINNPHIMVLLEEWKDWSSIENHIQSDSYHSILEFMELSSKQPEIKIRSFSDTKGLELIEKLRG